MPIRDNQSPSKSSSHPFQDQVKTKSGLKGFHISSFSSVLSSSSSHNSGTPNFHKGFQSTNQFGYRCCFKALVPTVNISYFLFSLMGLVVASGQHSCIHQGSSCYIKTAFPSHPMSSCHLKTAVLVNLTLQFILLVDLVNCSFPGVPSDTLEYSSL